MAKTLKEAPLTTRNARSKLLPGVHWRGIDPEVHLGYRKGRRGGSWLVRWRHGKGYRQAPLGTADDAMTGEGTLSFDEARQAANERVQSARAEAKAAADGAPLTVRGVVEAYIVERDARDARRRGRVVNSDASTRLRRYVIGLDASGERQAIDAAPLAEVPLHSLTEGDLIGWRKALPETMKSTTKQRLVNDLKAALNTAYASNRDRLDPTLPAIVKHGLKINERDHDDAPSIARDNQILKDAQIARLIGAAGEIDSEQGWDGDLYRFVVVLAATGARFSQICRMQVGDCQHKEGRLIVPASRKGRGKSGSTAIPVGRDVLDALLPVTTGRAADAPLLERWRHRQTATGGKDGFKWERTERGPWQSAAELTRPWQMIRERAALPDAIPYALRHSSIVRGIRANLPIRLVAALHDTSTAMIERHYSKWIVDGLEELAARAVVPLVPDDGGNVVKFAGRG